MFFLLQSPVLAASDVSVSQSTSEKFDVTVNCDEGVSAIAFIYTYKTEKSGIRSLYSVEKHDVPLGGTTTFSVTPPKDGLTEKLAVFNRVTLAPLCKAYEYPYIINLSTEPLGFKLKAYGTVDSDGKTYTSNEFNITGFTEYDPEEDFSAVALLSKSR